jgi:hypothetical protein
VDSFVCHEKFERFLEQHLALLDDGLQEPFDLGLGINSLLSGPSSPCSDQFQRAAQLPLPQLLTKLNFPIQQTTIIIKRPLHPFFPHIDHPHLPEPYLKRRASEPILNGQSTPDPERPHHPPLPNPNQESVTQIPSPFFS